MSDVAVVLHVGEFARPYRCYTKHNFELEQDNAMVGDGNQCGWDRV